MDRSLYCGCKGIRTCLMCETEYNLGDKQQFLFEKVKIILSQFQLMLHQNNSNNYKMSIEWYNGLEY